MNKTKRWKLTPHQRIMRAARKGCGIRLSADEVAELSEDDAMFQAAENDDEEQSTGRRPFPQSWATDDG